MYLPKLVVLLSVISVIVTATPIRNNTTTPPNLIKLGYVFDVRTSCYYKLFTKPMSFFEAVKICYNDDTELATPYTEEEAMVLITHMQKKVNEVWIGIHDRHNEGNFITLNGTSANNIYTNWGPGEPNNAAHGEDCAFMYKEGNYDDKICEKPTSFVCSKHVPFKSAANILHNDIAHLICSISFIYYFNCRFVHENSIL